MQTARLGRLELATTQCQHAALQVPGVGVARERDIPAHAAVCLPAALDALAAWHERNIARDARNLRGGLQQRLWQADLHTDEVAADTHGEWRAFVAPASREQQIDDVIRLAFDDARDRQPETLRQPLGVDDAAGPRDHQEPGQVRRRIVDGDFRGPAENRASQRFARNARAVDGHDAVQPGHRRIEALDLHAAVVGDDACRDREIP